MLKSLNYNPRYYVNYSMLFFGYIIEYGCELWGFSKSKELEKSHLNYI